MTATGEQMQEKVVATFQSFCTLVMAQLHPYIWNQPESVGRLSVISAAAALELLAQEMRKAGERDLKIPADMFQSATELCREYQMLFDLAVKSKAAVLQERKDRMH